MNHPNRKLTEDYLRSIKDDRLRKLFLDTRSQINKGRRKRINMKRVEEDFCWIQLEIQLRNDARKNRIKNRKNKGGK
jgi:hypothetical protein